MVGVVCLLFVGCATIPTVPDKPTVKEMKEWTLEYYYNHQEYANNPWYCNQYTGSVEWHRFHMKRYEKMYEYFKGVESGN